VPASLARTRQPARLLTRCAQSVRDKCFAKCVQTPGRSLSSTEQTCLQRCVDRYAEVTELVTQTFLSDEQ